MDPNLRRSQIYFCFSKMEVHFWFFSKMIRTRWRITKKTEENIWSKILLYAKRNKLYSFEEELSIKSLNLTRPLFQQIFVKTKKFFCKKYHQIGLQSAKLQARSDNFIFWGGITWKILPHVFLHLYFINIFYLYFSFYFLNSIFEPKYVGYDKMVDM